MRVLVCMRKRQKFKKFQPIPNFGQTIQLQVQVKHRTNEKKNLLSKRFLFLRMKNMMRPMLRAKRKIPTIQTTRMIMTGMSSEPCRADGSASPGGATPKYNQNFLSKFNNSNSNFKYFR